MEWRDRRRESAPRVVVLLDELAELVLEGGEGIEAPLVRLAQRGREAGIHLVAATQRPSAAVLSGLLRANFPLRLVGRVTSATDARVAAGRGGTEAHLLEGRGDFLAVGSGAEVIRFQAAYVNGAEMRREVEALCRRWG
jgi:S-DNA-T family DNA segregation ATPase FtsK/SpoIIIE